MSLINTNTLLPTFSIAQHAVNALLDKQTRLEIASVEGFQDAAFDVIAQLVDYARAQQREVQALRTALDHAVTALNQRINQRAGVGILAERPEPVQDGMLYLSIDETPPRLYAAAQGVWLGVDTN